MLHSLVIVTCEYEGKKPEPLRSRQPDCRQLVDGGEGESLAAALHHLHGDEQPRAGPRSHRAQQRDHGRGQQPATEDPLPAVPLGQEPAGDLGHDVAVVERAQDDALELGVPVEFALICLFKVIAVISQLFHILLGFKDSYGSNGLVQISNAFLSDIAVVVGVLR